MDTGFGRTSIGGTQVNTVVINKALKMNEVLEFSAILNGVPGIEALSIDFPYSVEEIYGVKGQVKVKVTYDGVEYRGSLAKMGHHCHFLIVRKDIRKLIGKNAGDTVWVTVQRDLEERIVVVPEDLAALFKQHPEAEALYEKLAYTHRKEYVQWINDAKKPETRSNRVAKTIEMLLNKKKNPTDK